MRWLKRLDEFFQVGGGLPRAAMRFLDRGDRHGKENSRLLDERGAFAGRTARQHFGDQDLLVELGQVQRLQSGGQRLVAQPARRFQPGVAALLQMRSQRRLIASRQIEKLAFHRPPNLAADPPHGLGRFCHQPLRAGDFIFETLGVAPRLLFQGEQPDIDAQQRLGDFILKFPADLLAFILLRRQHLVRQLPQAFLQFERILQTLPVVFAAFFEGVFHDLAPDDALVATGGWWRPVPPCAGPVSPFTLVKSILVCRAARWVSSIGVLASVKKISGPLGEPIFTVG